jgi:hypothetical protein
MRANTKEKHEMGRRFAILIAVAAAGVMALGAQTAAANSEGRTEGDARAAFNAVAGAGFTIADNHGAHEGAPIGGIPSGTDEEDVLDVQNPEDVRIYPGRSGFSYCASGWHVIFIAWWDDPQFHDSHEDLFAYLSAVDVQYAWDGVPLVEERTAIKRFNVFGDDLFFVAFGTFMPPGSLSVGKHRLTTTSFDPLYEEENGTWSVRVNILPC